MQWKHFFVWFSIFLLTFIITAKLNCLKVSKTYRADMSHPCNDSEAVYWRGRNSATFSLKKCNCRIKICRHAIFFPLKLWGRFLNKDCRFSLSQTRSYLYSKRKKKKTLLDFRNTSVRRSITDKLTRTDDLLGWQINYKGVYLFRVKYILCPLPSKLTSWCQIML